MAPLAYLKMALLANPLSVYAPDVSQGKLLEEAAPGVVAMGARMNGRVAKN